MGARVTGAGHCVPAPMDQANLWDGFFERHYAGNRLARRVFGVSGITTRHGVADPTRDDVSAWGTGARMQRYVAEAMPLGKGALASALDDAGLDPADLGMLAVVSCTGYATPGLDILLARDLGMDADLQRLMVGHMGCYAALPGLGAVSDFVTARGRPAAMLCLELPSLHVQPASPTALAGTPTSADLEQMVAHSLFGDAAAAVVLEPDGTAGAGWQVVDVVARTDVSTSDKMTWEVTDTGFRMGLSPGVPDVLARHVGDVVKGLLARNDLSLADVAGWAIHPGGRRIVEVAGEQLGLDDAALAPSYDVLRDFGNCSSATVLLVLERLAEVAPPADGAPVVAMAFGPGLTLYATLLRRQG